MSTFKQKSFSGKIITAYSISVALTVIDIIVLKVICVYLNVMYVSGCISRDL